MADIAVMAKADGESNEDKCTMYQDWGEFQNPDYECYYTYRTDGTCVKSEFGSMERCEEYTAYDVFIGVIHQEAFPYLREAVVDEKIKL